jgi:hypothetical protein
MWVGINIPAHDITSKPKEVIPMAMKERKCLSCATAYRYCPDCSRTDKLAPSWKAQFCSEPCMTLWTTLTKFGMSYLTKTEAKSIILELDLKPIESYAQCVQRDYAKVMANEKKPKRGKRIEIQPIDEVVDIEQVVVESIVEESHEVVIEKEKE